MEQPERAIVMVLVASVVAAGFQVMRLEEGEEQVKGRVSSRTV